ncbi:multidrug MFS transporter [Phyllobacterium brassicacearum]|uniref:Multidrug MFS transporter n=1 Tax=Phyllobacterium brassicacearum TaxID=314235 RepID=A0A2P7BUV5_9HYPH|nr:epoxide hydrolase family protein [Phyllobacterium brassicacearum]PSH70250.1 multidrug MFS transporter [Phyllobacterium brassicacearum]TDQ33857.1 pimeloyl-ACP methyl ester carboxylesterase [Phyllobacterium brassicacearum]
MFNQQTKRPTALTRRALLVNGAVVATLAVFGSQMAVVEAGAQALASNDIRPFRVNVSAESLADLRRRLAATRWPEAETVDDRSQGVQLSRLQALVRYWETDYDWRKAEQKLNSLPQFLTKIDGVDIHFIHVRSPHADAMPLIMTHGWPGSIFELLKVIGPLTDPTAHGGSAQDAFHLVLPSIPGFGFSEKPQGTGWNPDRIARTWDVLMKRIGYKEYASQGGDWGAIISDSMGRQAPEGLLGIHVNRIERSTTIPPEVGKALKNGDPAPENLSEEEKTVFNEAREFLSKGFGYAAIMGTRPQTIGYSLADSPVGLAAWFYDKLADWVFTRGEPERAFTRDEILDNITLYWLTNTGPSSSRIYWENSANTAMPGIITVPVAVTIFPGEVYRPPEHWAERAYPNLIYYNKVDKGGHFAAWEEPELFSVEVRAAFKSLR